MSYKLDLKNPLLQMLFSSNAQKILAFFLAHPTARHYDREVSHVTGVSRAGANFALRALANAGFLHREQKGRMFFYGLLEHDALTRSLKIVQNIAALKPLAEHLKADTLRIVLYGSAAKGEDHEESDIDLFILTRERERVEKVIEKYTSHHFIQLVVHSPQEWAKIEKNNPVFVKEVESGFVLWESHEP